MSAAFKTGQAVEQKVNPIKGVVKSFAFDPDEGVISYIVAHSDEHGDHETSFKAHELQAAAVAAEPDAEPAPE
jgi:hypothetical protein